MPRDSTLVGRIFAVGGAESDLGNNCISMEQFCWAKNAWQPFHNIPTFRKGFSAVHRNNELTIIGGEDQLGNLLATVRYFQPK